MSGKNLTAPKLKCLKKALLELITGIPVDNFTIYTLLVYT